MEKLSITAMGKIQNRKWEPLDLANELFYDLIHLITYQVSFLKVLLLSDLGSNRFHVFYFR